MKKHNAAAVALALCYLLCRALSSLARANKNKNPDLSSRLNSHADNMANVADDVSRV